MNLRQFRYNKPHISYKRSSSNNRVKAIIMWMAIVLLFGLIAFMAIGINVNITLFLD